MRDGTVRRGMIGVACQSGQLPQSLRRALHIEQPSAVEVVQVVPGGPAERTGIRPGDVIYKLDDHPIGTVDELRHFLERLSDGTRVRVALIRATPTGVTGAEAVVAVQVPNR
jgi:S1-C subfamily serine protease